MPQGTPIYGKTSEIDPYALAGIYNMSRTATEGILNRESEEAKAWRQYQNLRALGVAPTPEMAKNIASRVAPKTGGFLGFFKQPDEATVNQLTTAFQTPDEDVVANTLLNKANATERAYLALVKKGVPEERAMQLVGYQVPTKEKSGSMKEALLQSFFDEFQDPKTSPERKAQLYQQFEALAFEQPKGYGETLLRQFPISSLPPQMKQEYIAAFLSGDWRKLANMDAVLGINQEELNLNKVRTGVTVDQYKYGINKDKLDTMMKIISDPNLGKFNPDQPKPYESIVEGEGWLGKTYTPYVDQQLINQYLTGNLNMYNPQGAPGQATPKAAPSSTPYADKYFKRGQSTTTKSIPPQTR